MQARVRRATPDDSDAWDEFVRSRPDANFFQLYGWGGVFGEVFGTSPHYLLAETGSAIIGVLPLLVVERSVLGGNYISSLPGGICSGDAEAARLLIDAAIDLSRQEGAKYLKLRDGSTEWPDGRLKTVVETTYVLGGLPSDPDAVWNTKGARFRTDVRKARQANLRVEFGKAYLGDFYHAFSANMRDHGTPVLPRSFFERSLQNFPRHSHLLVVQLDSQVIGGMVLFELQGVLYNPFASSMRRFFRLHPNDLLYWEAIRFACLRGCRAFDMGRSLPNSGNARFKRKFLAAEKDLYYQYFLNRARRVPATRGGKGYEVVRRIWRHLPLAAANRLGPRLRRVVPLG